MPSAWGPSVGAEGLRSVLGPGGLVLGARPLCSQADQRPKGGAGGGASSEPQRGSQGGRPGRLLGRSPSELERRRWQRHRRGRGQGHSVGARRQEDGDTDEDTRKWCNHKGSVMGDTGAPWFPEMKP